MSRPSRAELLSKCLQENLEKPLQIVEEQQGKCAGTPGFVSLRNLMESLGCTFGSALNILREESIPLHVHPTGHVRYEISKAAIPRLLANHATEAARQQRRVRAACRNGQPVSPACPKCGQVGRQWRHNPTAEGMEMAICGGCRKRYWSGAMRNGVKVTCPQCGAVAPNLHIWSRFSRLNFRCCQCETYFSVGRLRPNLFGKYESRELDVKVWTKREPVEEHLAGDLPPAQQPQTEPANPIAYDPVEPDRAPQLDVRDSTPAPPLHPAVRDTQHPFQWFCVNWEQYMPLPRLKAELQMDGSSVLNLLKREGLYALRLRVSERRFRFYVPRELAQRVIRKHGTPEAIAERRAKYLAGRRPVNAQCPRCGAYGKHWRAGFCSDGKRILECTRCRKRHTVNSTARPPLISTCIHCGATTRQQRRFVTMQGQLGVKCGHCRKVYSIEWQPDPSRPEENQAIERRLNERHLPIDSQCPFCAKSGHQWRRHIQLSGELKIQCGHCRRHYTLVHNPPTVPSIASAASTTWRRPVEKW